MEKLHFYNCRETTAAVVEKEIEVVEKVAAEEVKTVENGKTVAAEEEPVVAATENGTVTESAPANTEEAEKETVTEPTEKSEEVTTEHKNGNSTGKQHRFHTFC